MFKILLKNLLKYKYIFFIFLFIWILSGIFVYQHRFKLLSFLYNLSSDFPEIGKENPKKAYFDFVKTAIEILEKNNINLNLMQELCPKEIKANILTNSEYEWDFLKKYNLFAFESQYILGNSYIYWKEKKELVLNAILYLKEAQKYATEIPSEITQEKKTILIPILLEQTYNGICLPNESRINWKKYIQYIENSTYRKYIENNMEKKEILPFPREFDLELLRQLENNEKYIFAIQRYIGKSVPFEYLNNCPDQFWICSQLKESEFYYNKLIFVYPFENLGNIFLNHGRIYFLLANQTKDPKYYELALDRYSGAKDFSNSYIDAYLEMIYLFLSKGENNKAFETINEFKEIRPKIFPQQTLYYELIFKVLTRLGHFEEAECFKDIYLDTEECKTIREKF